MGTLIKNCVLCKWFRVNDSLVIIQGYCMAQGAALAKDVYGNDKCEALYSEIEPKELKVGIE